MPVTASQYRMAYLTNQCVNCNRQITIWRKFLRLFWAPIFCDTSIFWKICCSRKCLEEVLERELKELWGVTSEQKQ